MIAWPKKIDMEKAARNSTREQDKRKEHCNAVYYMSNRRDPLRTNCSSNATELGAPI